MRRALQGESGTIVGLDYRSERVLAAYEPIPELGWGVVAKIDTAEINGPFVTAGLLAVGIAAVVVAVGIAVMLRVESPLIGRIEDRVVERTERLSEAVREQAHLQQLLRSAASEAALAEERERRKLAADLHDGLGQLLTLAAMKLGMLRDSVQDPELVSQVREVETVIAEADERTSSLSFELSPPFLHDMGIVAAAQWLAEEVERRFGLHVAVESDERRHPLSTESRITLFRALSEALQNVARHAHADSASVRLEQEGGFMSISIQDDGVGFDPDAESGGYGLLSNRERLSHLGGRMLVESTPGKGTWIRLMVPLADADGGADGVSS
jgi:signal transduction histidine kinase